MLKFLIANRASVYAIEVPAGAIDFTYHRNSAIQALLAGLLMVAIVEATVLHLLLAMWNHWVALVATLSTAWVALQIVAQIRAVTMRPIYFLNDRLVLRNGAFDLAEISVDQIERIELTTKDLPEQDDEKLKPLCVAFPASHNVVIRLKEPAESRILNRNKRKFQIALLAIDDDQKFVDLIEKKMQPVDQSSDTFN